MAFDDLLRRPRRCLPVAAAILEAADLQQPIERRLARPAGRTAGKHVVTAASAAA